MRSWRDSNRPPIRGRDQTSVLLAPLLYQCIVNIDLGYIKTNYHSTMASWYVVYFHFKNIPDYNHFQFPVFIHITSSDQESLFVYLLFIWYHIIRARVGTKLSHRCLLINYYSINNN